MNLGTGTKWWQFEARITSNILNSARRRGLEPSLAQQLYNSLALALAEEDPAELRVKLISRQSLTETLIGKVPQT
jgi:hypothetical protein